MGKEKEAWVLASTWVNSNRVKIRYIAGPYFRYMPGDEEDLTSEALLVAYQTIISLLHNSGDLELMSRYFQVRFKTHCIKMAAGVPTITLPDITTLPILPPDPSDHKNHKELNHKEIPLEKNKSLTKKQRLIVGWILNQDIPVSTKKTGAHFGVSARAIRLILNNAITRLNNGHNGIRKDLKVAA